MELLLRLQHRIAGEAGSLPLSVNDWLVWTVDWLRGDADARTALFYDVKRAIMGACGARKDDELTAHELELIMPGLLAWTEGQPLAAIERALGGDPDAAAPTKQICPRASELVGSVIPRGFSLIMGLVADVVEEADPFDAQEDLSRHLIECLGTAVRKGFNLPELIAFAAERPGVLSRVQVHLLWAEHDPINGKPTIPLGA